jgi:hypothetical protein
MQSLLNVCVRACVCVCVCECVSVEVVQGNSLWAYPYQLYCTYLGPQSCLSMF